MPIKNQQTIEWWINLNRKKSVKQRISKMADAPQIRLDGKFEQRGINRFEKSPGQFFSGLVMIPLELPGDIRMEQQRFLNGKTHPRFSRMTFSHAARISSDE